MFGSGCETLPNVRECWETLPNDRQMSRSPTGCAGMVGGLPGCLGVVEMPSRMSWSGQKTLPDVRE